MPHTYVVSTNTAMDDVATVTGTVDGIPVTVNYYVSYIKQLQQSGGLAAVKTYVASLMLAAATPVTPVVVSQLPTGTFVQ